MTRDDTAGSTAVQSIPPGAVSRSRPSGFRAAACALAAAFALLLAAGAAQAQTEVTLVSNLGQTSASATGSADFDHAQAFITGSNANGYTLKEVQIALKITGTSLPTYAVEIWSAPATETLGTRIATLTNPASLQDGTNSFTSSSGVSLDANTRYMVLVDLSSSGTNWAIVNTASDAEDTGATAGFSILDTGAYRSRTSTGVNLTNYNDARKIAIKGYAKSNPPKVTGVEISSTPSLDVDDDNTPETYGLGEKIQVQVTFDKNVTVTGTPRLKIKMDPNFGEKWANYESGSGSKVLTFAYTVVNTPTVNISTQGIAVLQNSLALNGGTIKNGTVNANLAHDGKNHNAAHKVDARLQPATPTPKSPASQRPSFTSGFGPLRLEPGAAMTPVTLPAATGGGGAPYTYALTSSPAGLAGLSFDAGTRTLSGTPEAEGRWTFSYTAHDNDADTTPGDAAILTFRVSVGVAVEQQQQVVRRTLAEVASRTIAGAVANIGTRLGDAAPSPGMTIAGETVRFGAFGTGDAEERWAAACPAGGFDDGFGRRGLGNGFEDCAPRAGSRGVHTGALLPASAFSWTLGASAGDKEGENRLDPDAPRWAVWGRGDFGSFSGRPDTITSYSGETRTGWLGVDVREAPRPKGRPGRWVAGLAVSRGTSETDYTLDGEEGRIETDLTALWPYGRWTFANGLELRGMLGAGRGEARHTADDGETREKSRLRMWTGSVGLRRPLPPVAGIDLAARGDVSLARMQTAKGDGDEEQAVDGILADAWRLRGGIEASRRIPFDDGSSLTPFVETAARRDGGDGVTGTGIEVAGGLRVAAPGLQVEARGRWLAAHSEKGALDGELGYGIGLFGGRLTGTPNVGFGASDGGGRDYRLGWRLTPAVRGYAGFRVDLDATRRESANANEPPSHGAMLTGAIRW